MEISDYTIVTKKLESFIRKYYKNMLVKGMILGVTLVLAYFIIIIILEYYNYFKPLIKISIFYSFLILSAVIVIYFVIFPLMKMFRLGKTITYKQCASIISVHFEEIKDKLLNIIELKSQLNEKCEDNELIIASINQKINRIKPFNFLMAINIRKNKKYLKFLSIPVLTLLLILLTAPTILTDASKRILLYNTEFQKPNPFQFEIMNESFVAIQQEDYELNVKVKGKKLPDKVYIIIGNYEFPMQKKSKTNFSYLFKNMQNQVVFKLMADNYETQEFKLNVIKKPMITNFDVLLNYPEYTGKKIEKLSNIGDIFIPEGTRLTWIFSTMNTKQVNMKFDEKLYDIRNTIKGNFVFSEIFYKNANYTIKTMNENMLSKDSLVYKISVINDQYPQIDVDVFQDTLYQFASFFSGNYKDDYGFSKLTFVYQLYNEDSLIKREIIKIPIHLNVSYGQFNYFSDFSNFGLKPGDRMEYYFEIFDNDAIHGPKSSKSTVNILEIPSLEEMNKITETKNETIKSELSEKISELNELQDKLEKIRKKSFDKEKISWQEKNELNDILEKMKMIKNDIQVIQQQNYEKSIYENEITQTDKEILEKQKKLEELFNEVINEDTKKLFDELQKLLNNVEKNKIQELIEKMQLSNQDILDQLDRNLELFKQLEFEQKLDKLIEQIQEIKNKQDSLSELTNKTKKENLQNLKKEQQQIKNDFKNLRNELDKLDTLNNNLENKKNLENTTKKEEEIENEMEKSIQDMNNKDKENAKKSQKKSSEKLEELMNELSDMKEKEMMEQQEEDIENLRQILENLIQSSFNQEELISITKKINVTDPKYLKIIQEQKKISDDMKIIEDSLLSLSKRQMQIESYINNEINKINKNIEKSIQFLNDRNISGALVNQQLSMTSLNNLALLLSESLSNMKENCKSGGGGKGKKGAACKKPGSGKPDLESIRKLQQQLNKELKDWMDGNMQNNGKNNNNTMSEKLAKLAAQQQMLRNQLKQVQEQLKKEGSGTAGAKEIKKISDLMEQTENDLVNKIISKQLMERQKEIETRLLESEKSEKEKEFEKKRESNEAKKIYFSNKILKNEYNRYKTNENEIIKMNNPLYNYFYKNKISEYYNNFNQ